MPINFLFTVYTNIMVSSLLPRILWLLCFSFIVLYYLHFNFYACKNDTNNISNQHKTKTNIAIYKSLGKSKDRCIYNPHSNFQDSMMSIFTQCEALGFYNWEKVVKVRMWENAHEKKEKHLTWHESPFDIGQIIHVKDIMHAKYVTEWWQEMLKCQNQLLSFSPQKTLWSILHLHVSP